MRRVALLLGVAAVASPLPAAPAGQWTATGKWNVEFADDHCYASRGFQSGARSITLVFEERPTEAGYRMHLIVPERETEGWFRAPVALGGRRTETGKFGIVAVRNKGQSMIGTDLTAAELDRIAAGDRIEVGPAKQRVELTPSAVPEVRKLLQSCASDLLEGWGFPKSGQAKIATFPKPVQAASSYVHYQDYPRAAINRGAAGRVQVLVDVASSGKATGCRVILSSRDPDLDATTSGIFTRRVRYQPAVGVDGKPVDGPYVSQLSWTMHE